jgi:hypothetical protein
MFEVAKNSLPRIIDLYFRRLKNCEKRNIVHVKRKRANWISHILSKNCLLKHVIEGKIEGKGTRRIRHKQLVDDLKKTRKYWNVKD